MYIHKITKSLQENDMKGFALEESRKKLLRLDKIKELLETYNKEMPSIPDENSGDFWDKKFSASISAVHHMEIDRNKIVSKFVKPQLKILNLAAGKGNLERVIYSKYKSNLKWVGTDITNKALNELSMEFPNWEFIRSRLDSVKYSDESFDLIFLLEVLEHIKPSETFKVLREIHRLLKKNGTFIISVPINEGLLEMYPLNPNAHVRVYSEDLIKFELGYCGFEAKRVIKLTAFSKLYFVKKVLNSIFGFREPNNLILICKKND